jgi:hypothetical protein
VVMPRTRVRNEITGETYEVPQSWPDLFGHLKRVGGKPTGRTRGDSPVVVNESEPTTAVAPGLGEEE